MPTRWWQGGDALLRWMADLIRAEAAGMRGTVDLPAGPWDPDATLDEAGLGFDSLERLSLAASVSEALHMHRSGIADLLLAQRRFGEWCAIAAQSLERFSAEMTFRTSGSTGTRKAAAHAIRRLEEEVEGLAGTAFAGISRVAIVVPVHHIYGFLFGILLPRRLDVALLDGRGRSPGGLVAGLRAGDLVVGYPDFWAAMARAVPRGWPAGVTGLTSTAPLAAEVADGLVAAGLARLIDIHGASETAGIGWRDAARADYTLMRHWRRFAKDQLVRDGIAVAMPDLVEWTGPRHYRVLGRADGAVQVGGINVYPARVRALLCTHPDVRDAAVRLMTPEEGHRLKAFIVPRDPAANRDALAAGLDTLMQSVPAAERPRDYAFGDALPQDALGKLADWRVARTSEVAG